MAKWLSFTADYNHRHPSRAVTAYKKGMVKYVPERVAESAIAKGKAEVVDKPTDADGRIWLNG